MSLMDAWCPTADSYLALGDGPALGVSLTSGGGSVFFYSDIDTNIDANGSLWLQSNADGGIVCRAGVTIGTPSGIKAAAGGNVDIWAGASTQPNVGSPNGSSGPPEAPSAPCADTQTAVDRANALNSAIKGAADVVSGVQDAMSGDSKIKRIAGAWDAAKGLWDIVKAGGDAGLYDLKTSLGEHTVDGIDGGIGVVDQLLSAAKGDIPNVVGGIQSGRKLGEAIAGLLGEDGSGGGAQSGAGGRSGGPTIEARAPGGITKLTDGEMKAFVGKDIKYKAGGNIAMNAMNKIETCSMVFEAHANIAATMRGLARAKVESFGKAVVDGKASFKVSTSGTGTIQAGGRLEIEGRGGVKMHSPASVLLQAGSTLTGKANQIKLFGKTEIDGETVIKKKTVVDDDVVITKNLEVKGEIKGLKPVVFYQNVTIKSVTKITANVFLG